MKRIIFLLTVFGCFMSGNANAGFISGYAFTWGSIDADVEIKGTGKTSDGDTVTLSGTYTDVEYVCGNPGINNYVVSGTPGEFTVDESVPIGEGTAIQKNGVTTVKVIIEIDESGLACVNPNWTPLAGSAAPKTLNLDIIWSDCSGKEPNPNEPDPNELCEAQEGYYVVKDQVEVECTLDPVLRYPENTFIEDEFGNLVDVSLLPVKGQTYDCEIQPPPL